jgi:hypothetical protein
MLGVGRSVVGRVWFVVLSAVLRLLGRPLPRISSHLVHDGLLLLVELGIVCC